MSARSPAPGDGPTRCPQCRATNPGGAQWCGQCYEPLGEPEPSSGQHHATGSPAPLLRPAEPTPRTEPARVAEPARSGGRAPGGFRARAGQVEWSCTACGTYNPLDLSTCGACGTPLIARFETPESRREPAETDWRLALALTVVLPGAGHLLAGRPAAGVARALLYAVWLGGGLLLVGGGRAALAAVPLLLGAVTVWAGSVLDIMSLPRDGPEMLGSRALLWVVVGVTMLSLTGLLAGFVSLT